MTGTQIYEYVQAYSRDIKEANIGRGVILYMLNDSILKAQNDLRKVGLNQFRRKYYFTGSRFTVPSDMMAVPDAVVDIQAGVGTVRPAIDCVFTGSNNNILVTALQPGTPNNNCAVSFVAGAALAIRVSFTTPDQWTIFVTFVTGVSTAAQVITAINTDPIASYLAVASSSEGSAAGTIGTEISFTLVGGTGTGFYPADEVTPEDIERIRNNTLLNPDYTNPKFARVGSANSTKSKIIQMLPAEISYGIMEYDYVIADMTLLSETIAFPREYIPLIEWDVLAKVYDILDRSSSDDMKKVQYAKEKEDLEAKYQERLAGKATFKQDINSLTKKD